MNLFNDKLLEWRDESTHNRMVDNIQRSSIIAWDTATGGPTPGYVENLKGEFILKCTLAINFWANHEEFYTARQAAKKTIAYRLYGDIPIEVQNARFAISNGDRDAALAALNAIEKYITSV